MSLSGARARTPFTPCLPTRFLREGKGNPRADVVAAQNDTAGRHAGASWDLH